MDAGGAQGGDFAHQQTQSQNPFSNRFDSKIDNHFDNHFDNQIDNQIDIAAAEGDPMALGKQGEMSAERRAEIDNKAANFVKAGKPEKQEVSEKFETALKGMVEHEVNRPSKAAAKELITHAGVSESLQKKSANSNILNAGLTTLAKQAVTLPTRMIPSIVSQVPSEILTKEAASWVGGAMRGMAHTGVSIGLETLQINLGEKLVDPKPTFSDAKLQTMKKQVESGGRLFMKSMMKGVDIAVIEKIAENSELNADAYSDAKKQARREQGRFSEKQLAVAETVLTETLDTGAKVALLATGVPGPAHQLVSLVTYPSAAMLSRHFKNDRSIRMLATQTLANYENLVEQKLDSTQMQEEIQNLGGNIQDHFLTEGVANYQRVRDLKVLPKLEAMESKLAQTSANEFRKGILSESEDKRELQDTQRAIALRENLNVLDWNILGQYSREVSEKRALDKLVAEVQSTKTRSDAAKLVKDTEVRSALIYAIVAIPTATGAERDSLTKHVDTVRLHLKELGLDLNETIGVGEDTKAHALKGLDGSSLLGVGDIKVDQFTNKEINSLLEQRAWIRRDLNNLLEASANRGEKVELSSESKGALLKEALDARNDRQLASEALISYRKEVDDYIHFRSPPSDGVISKMIDRYKGVSFSPSWKQTAYSSINKTPLLLGMLYGYTPAGDYITELLEGATSDQKNALGGAVATAFLAGTIANLDLGLTLQPTNSNSNWKPGLAQYYILPELSFFERLGKRMNTPLIQFSSAPPPSKNSALSLRPDASASP